MPPRILLYHFLGLLSSLECCPWLNGQPTIPTTSILSEWPKIMIANPKSSAWKTLDLLQYFWAGIKETDKVRAPKRDLWRFQNNAFLLVASKRNIRKHLNMEIFGNLQVNDEQRRIARKFSIKHVRPVNVWMKTFVKIQISQQQVYPRWPHTGLFPSSTFWTSFLVPTFVFTDKTQPNQIFLFPLLKIY